ncbi:unnamed protein product [Caenorhabditis auriculariae]|uniref:Uncharacterized protein n=1 Tax=Caenorhabditis auriculariae TaxID=2777116 RepID=A0A8S1HN38_9PELO|nr:unnamed protein product [Caenorhabditis auriculariae]
METDEKVQHFLQLLYNEFGEDVSSIGVNMLRGPGQKASDPFQFVAGRGGDLLAEDAKNVISIAHQQKSQREKILEVNRAQASKSGEQESWQDDLDTWRKKRKDRLSSEKSLGSEPTTPTTRQTCLAEPFLHRKERDEILTISNETDHNDSGIENRTTESPSTSIDFSPRSADLISPKSGDIPHSPSYGERPAKLDQVVIPLSYSQKSLLKNGPEKDYSTARNDTEPNFYEENKRIIETRPYMPVISTKVEATFPQPIPRDRVKPFVSQAAANLRDSEKSEHIDMTVELNREQKATVTASKFPRPEHSSSVERPLHSNHSLSTPNVNGMTSSSTASLSESPTRNLRASSSGRIYRAVDIPFDESPASYFPNKNSDEGMFTLAIEMGSQPVHKGIGMTAGRKEGRAIVESVIVGSPADRAGLLVGDVLVAINGEPLAGKSSSFINELVREAANAAHSRIRIQRAPVYRSTSSLSLNKQNSPAFDKARSNFVDSPTFGSYAEFKRNHSRSSRDSTSTRSSREYNSLPRASSNQLYDRQRDTSLSSYRTARETFANNSIKSLTSRNGRDPDYRVTSLEERGNPGKLTDFVPEVDREPESRDSHTSRGEYEEPRLIRNYDLPAKTVSLTKEESTREASATLKRSTLPRNGPRKGENLYYDEDISTEDVKPPREFRSCSPACRRISKEEEVFQRSRQVDDFIPYGEDRLSTRRYGRQFFSTSDLRSGTPRISFEKDDCDHYEDMHRRRDFYTVGSYRNLPPRARSTDSRVYWDSDVSDVSHRFYDRHGNFVGRRQDGETDIEIRRDYARRHNPIEESRDWRDVINQQRQPAPGMALDRRAIEAASAPLGNLPTYISRRIEESRRAESEERLRPQTEKLPAAATETYERNEYNRYEKHEDFPSTNLLSSHSRGLHSHLEKSTYERKEEHVVAVSGKHKCAHCNEELGRGAAMIVESLNLFYHLNCFRCYVCNTSLGSGTAGADVRVRESRLHCQSCYNNERVRKP